jgi:FkbM family methyltransferase
MTASKLARIAGRVPQRVRRTVPAPLRNALVERYGHPVAPSDGPAPTEHREEIPPPEDREGIDNRHLELLLGFVLAEDSNCIDVGANEGRFLRQMTERAPRGRHVAWEPLPELAQRLRDRFPGVDVHEAAVADAGAPATPYVKVQEDPAYSGLIERAYPGEWHVETIDVRVERIDDVLAPEYAPTLIKIDVEGGELGVLRSAARTIAQHRPIIVFEHGLGASDRYGTTPEHIHDFLTGLGMRIFDLDAAGPLSREQFREIYDAGSRWNFLARP